MFKQIKEGLHQPDAAKHDLYDYAEITLSGHDIIIVPVSRFLQYSFLTKRRKLLEYSAHAQGIKGTVVFVWGILADEEGVVNTEGGNLQYAVPRDLAYALEGLTWEQFKGQFGPKQKIAVDVTALAEIDRQSKAAIDAYDLTRKAAS